MQFYIVFNICNSQLNLISLTPNLVDILNIYGDMFCCYYFYYLLSMLNSDYFVI